MIVYVSVQPLIDETLSDSCFATVFLSVSESASDGATVPANCIDTPRLTELEIVGRGLMDG